MYFKSSNTEVCFRLMLWFSLELILLEGTLCSAFFSYLKLKRSFKASILVSHHVNVHEHSLALI